MGHGGRPVASRGWCPIWVLRGRRWGLGSQTQKRCVPPVKGYLGATAPSTRAGVQSEGKRTGPRGVHRVFEFSTTTVSRLGT